MADVRRQRVDLALLPVQPEGEEPALPDPEIPVEAALQISGLGFQLLGPGGGAPHLAGETGGSHLGVVDIPLQLAGRARRRRQRSVGERDRIPGILPALILEAGLLVAAFVLDVAVAVAVAVLVDPAIAARACDSISRASARSPV